MKHVQENLAQFRDNKFFYGLLEEWKGFMNNDDKKDKKEDKEDKKSKWGKKQDKISNKETKNIQQEKITAAIEKDALDVIKKCSENYKLFKKFAGDKIQAYKTFLDLQKKALAALKMKNDTFTKVFSLYDSDFVVALRNIDGKIMLQVIKKTLGEGEENPFFSASNKKAIGEFNNFIAFMSNDMANVKEHYIKTVENVKKEKEQKEKREKLDKFLKESKNLKKNLNEAEIPQEEIGNLENYQVINITHEEAEKLGFTEVLFYNFYKLEENGEFVAYVVVGPDGSPRFFTEPPTHQEPILRRRINLMNPRQEDRFEDVHTEVIPTESVDLNNYNITAIESDEIGYPDDPFINFYKMEAKNGDIIYAKVDTEGKYIFFRINES